MEAPKKEGNVKFDFTKPELNYILENANFTEEQEKNVIMKVAQAEKENYHHLKQMMDK